MLMLLGNGDHSIKTFNNKIMRIIKLITGISMMIIARLGIVVYIGHLIIYRMNKVVTNPKYILLELLVVGVLFFVLLFGGDAIYENADDG